MSPYVEFQVIVLESNVTVLNSKNVSLDLLPLNSLNMTWDLLPCVEFQKCVLGSSAATMFVVPKV